MAITWGSTFGSGNKMGRFGTEYAITSTDTMYIIAVTGYFQTRYKTSDSANEFFYDWDSYAHISMGAKSISHGSNSSWSSSNITKLGSWKKTFARGETDQTNYFSLRCVNVEYGGGSGASYFSFVVPKLENYRVSYDANGGSGAPSVQEKGKGEILVLSSVVPVLEGHSFQGWGTSASDITADYQPGDSYSADASITLYAIWKEVKEQMALKQNGIWRKGTVSLGGRTGTPWIKKDGVWRKGGA